MTRSASPGLQGAPARHLALTGTSGLPGGEAASSRIGESRRRAEDRAELLRKVFAVDVLACPDCEGRLEMIAFIADQAIARMILDHLELDATGPPLAAARRATDPIDPSPDYDVADPVYDA